MDPKLTDKASDSEIDLELGSGGEVEIAKGFGGVEKHVEKTETFRNSQKRIKTILPNTQPVPRRRKDVVSRTGYKFNLKEEDIYEVTQYYDEYTVGATTLKGLAKFDDCDEYGISEESHKRLVRKEIQKLIKAVANDKPFLFDSKGNLKATDEEGFDTVSNLMDQIICAFYIITHDFARIGVENCPCRMEQMISEFKKSRRKIVSRFKQDTDKIQGTQPVKVEPPKLNREIYYALVDYLIGSMARIIVCSATGHFWGSYTLAILALWAVKLKILAYDPSKNAGISLSNGEDVIDRMVGGLENKRQLILKVRLSPSSQESEFDTLNTEADITSLYYEENILFRIHLANLFVFTVNSMYAGHKTKRDKSRPDCFETCTLMYKTGLEEVLTAVGNDRYGPVSATSDSLHTNFVYGGLRLLLQNIEEVITRRSIDGPPLEEGCESPATVKWEWSEGGAHPKNSSGTLMLRSMDEVISMTVMQCLSSPYAVVALKILIHVASSGSSDEDPVMQFRPPHKSFQAMFNIVTAEFQRKQQSSVKDRYHDTEVQSISMSPLTRRIRAGTDLQKLNRGLDSAGEHSTQQILSEYAVHRQNMDSWVISEDSVTIKCRIYVVLVILFALFMVLGCLTIGDRIKGVDPFQLATFGWVIAGFIVVLAKGRYVCDWPWHHFLRGRVVCHSVKDIHEVTGINPQMIIMKLLHDEYSSILRTRGPFNGMFGRKASALDGFSINVPVKLSTMLASGFIVLKVVNETGEHLICEDVRKGAPPRYISSDDDTEFLVCKDIGRDALEFESDDEDGSSVNPKKPVTKRRGEGVFYLKTVEGFHWRKVLGLYIRDSEFG